MGSGATSNWRVTFLPIIIFHCCGIRGGLLSIKGVINQVPLLGAHYLVDLSKRFAICEELEYWQKEMKEIEGTRSKECIFSSLSFRETLFFTLNKWGLEFKLGPGMGIHLLKNYVKEQNIYGDYRITEYYSLTSNPIGFHIDTRVGVKLPRVLLSCGVRFGIILLPPDEQNLFYTRGDIKETIYSIGVSF